MISKVKLTDEQSLKSSLESVKPPKLNLFADNIEAENHLPFDAVKSIATVKLI